MYQYVPNGITWSRLVISFPLGALTFFSAVSPACHVVALALMAYVMVSDFADGRLARRWHVVSPSGAWLDQLADKLVDGCVYLALVLLYRDRLLLLLAAGIGLRHVVIMILRQQARSMATAIPARRSGKIRTALSFGLSFVLLARVPYRVGTPHALIESVHHIPAWLMDATIWLVLAITLFTLVDYCRAHRHLFHRALPMQR